MSESVERIFKAAERALNEDAKKVESEIINMEAAFENLDDEEKEYNHRINQETKLKELYAESQKIEEALYAVEDMH